jgi:hypothetical protein
MGSRFHQLSLIETVGSRATFREITRTAATDGEELHPWMVRMLSKHRCNLGLYVAEAGAITDEGDEIDADLWLAWDGVAAFSTTE